MGWQTAMVIASKDQPPEFEVEPVPVSLALALIIVIGVSGLIIAVGDLTNIPDWLGTTAVFGFLLGILTWTVAVLLGSRRAGVSWWCASWRALRRGWKLFWQMFP
jgi:hypothetical protein